MNDFSTTWYSVFLAPIPAKDSDTETAFVLRHLPPQNFPSLLDLCCGPGRHALRLASHGYHILGIDKNMQAIAQAQHHACAWFNEQLAPSPEHVRMQFVFEREG